ncbi:hypothetical protein ASG67_14460 [Sphingomonas sp. Leaf339]|uniref:glycine zipper 2TM domain-containing protein n=1 Tax=Sphingomonas sp. Leaf339 TaxID=1736343 RepID=UPI0007019B3F|nr:glycine zipper 2TM domain-containing protein [Sphingomonas sp. Leaf339]KQU47449.1 hypothetical protein ASG67_14460 [Sphingomonas sp. Leaf339]
MFKKISLAAAALAMGASTLVPVSAADAQRRYYRDNGYSQRDYRERRNDYRPRQCKDGSTGAIIGAIAGGLLGRTIDTRGDRTMGTLLGAGAGGLAGRAVERSDRPGYCRR